MKCWIIFLALSVSLCGRVKTLPTKQTANDVYCETIQKAGTVCFDERTLGTCILFGGQWYGYVTAPCSAAYNMCCRASINGCVVSEVCEEDVLEETCEYGDMMPNTVDCRSYYYCSNGKYTPGSCPIGKYDDTLKSCVLGSC